MPSHIATAQAGLASVAVYRDALDDLYATPNHDRRRAASLHDQIRMGLKVAEVNALLAIAEQLADHREDQAMADAVERERRERLTAALDEGFTVVDESHPCRRARGMHCHRHNLTHGRPS